MRSRQWRIEGRNYFVTIRDDPEDIYFTLKAGNYEVKLTPDQIDGLISALDEIKIRREKSR